MSEITGNTSDGYHTFNELYAHRTALLAAWTKSKEVHAYGKDIPWRSRKHSNEEDFPMFDGMFIVGLDLDEGQVTYHIDIKDWSLFDHCMTLENARSYDGHTPAQALRRIERWVQDE